MAAKNHYWGAAVTTATGCAPQFDRNERLHSTIIPDRGLFAPEPSEDGRSRPRLFLLRSIFFTQPSGASVFGRRPRPLMSKSTGCPRMSPLFSGWWPEGVVAISAMTALHTPSIHKATRSACAIFSPTACKVLMFMVRPA